MKNSLTFIILFCQYTFTVKVRAVSLHCTLSFELLKGPLFWTSSISKPVNIHIETATMFIVSYTSYVGTLFTLSIHIYNGFHIDGWKQKNVINTCNWLKKQINPFSLHPINIYKPVSGKKTRVALTTRSCL